MKIKIGMYIGLAAALALFLGSVIGLAHSIGKLEGQSTTPKTTIEKVVLVLGRVNINFDGLGASVGLLVKDGENLKIIHYTPGTKDDDVNFRPKYLSVLESPDGKIVWNPLEIQAFD